MWDSAKPIALNATDRNWLNQVVRSPKTPQKVAFRAMIVLGAGDGVSNNQLAQQLATSRPTVLKWRDRFEQWGMEGLVRDAPRPGRNRRITAAQETALVEATLRTTPRNATHGSVRTMAKAQGVSRATVHRIWQAYGLQPHRVETFKLSADPEFVAKVRDIAGLYLDPPDRALVLSVDEKSQIQALDRTQPVLPLRPGIPQRQTHDYTRHGTTTLFAALNILNGKVIGSCLPRHRHSEFLLFLDRIEIHTPKNRQIHLIRDNYGTHTHPKVKEWFQAHPRYHLHFTPTGASWINLVERWFAALTEKQLRRGVHRSTRELKAAIQHYLKVSNENSKPFVWTKTADQIFASLARYCERISGTGH